MAPAGYIRLGRNRRLAGAPTPTLRRLFRGLYLGVLDLLEDLAHSRPHECTLFRRRVAIASARPFGLARVQVLAHGVMVDRSDLNVNWLPGRS